MPGERFNVRLAPEEGGSPEPVVVEVGLEGFNILSPGSGRALRKYPLHHISRWSMRGSSLILFAKSPMDVEDRTVVLSGDEHTIRSVLDTLTSSCMQMAELLQSGRSLPGGADAAQAASSLTALLRKAKRPALLTADQVEFWRSPEKAGWMHSQGEHIRTWRKRWFVLKQGFLFRFSAPDPAPGTRARGVVDLSTVTDVGDGNSTTGRPNSLKLSTATGKICYLADSETAQVEWLSALEGAVAAIVRQALEETLQRSFAAESAAASSRGKRTTTHEARPGMISVVNYGGGAAAAHRSEPDSQFVNVDYGGSIAGANTLAPGRGGDAYGAGPGASSYGVHPGAGGYSGAQQYGVPAPQSQAVQYGTGGGPYDQQYGQQYGGGGQQLDQQYSSGQYDQQYGGEGGGGGGQYEQQYGSQPTLFDAATAPQAAAPAAPASPWQTHHTADGRPYYYHVVSGITQWEVPST